MNAHSPMPAIAAAPPPVRDLIGLAGRIAAAYVAGNAVPAGDLPRLIQVVHGGLLDLPRPGRAPKVERPTEAQIATSIRPDAIFSFEDGKPYKALRRHLTLRGLTPEAYRRKWGLPVDYPMVAASYSARRSEISKGIELGRGGMAPAAGAVAT